MGLFTDQIWQILEDISDPEIPAVSVVELGMVRSVGVEGEKVIVTVTPTFVACPAQEVIQSSISARLRAAGVEEVEVKVTYKPPWSSDQITEEGRRKLKEFGLAPPPRHGGQLEAALQRPAVCPYCDSSETEWKNDFGSTQCRAIYVCQQCKQPFEQFKPI